jgi:hypothetical protein
MVKKAPKLLAQAITRQRLVPSGFELSEFELDRVMDPEMCGGVPLEPAESTFWFWPAFKIPPGANFASTPKEFVTAKHDFDALIRPLPKAFRHYLRAEARLGKSEVEQFLRSVVAYDNFRKEREALISIVAVARLRKTAPASFLQSCGIEIPTALLHVNKLGQFEIEIPLLYRELVHDEVEAEYIRECASCGQVFWAARIESTGCSPKCNQAVRDRRWYERYHQGLKSYHKLPAKSG